MFGPLYEERIRATIALGYVPRIKRPRTFNEKLLHRKLFDPLPNAQIIADKWGVRRYVEERIGPYILNEVHGVYRTADEIDFERLPDEFVIKMNNATKRNILVPAKAKADLGMIRRKLDHWGRNPFGIETGELWYLEMEPLILVERFLRDENGKVPCDYSFHVFHGETRYVETQVDRFGPRGDYATSSNWYDLEWNVQRIKQGTPNGPLTSKPVNFEEMVHIANRLADGMEYVRVDLYSIGGKRIVFGEITVAPSAGRGRIEPLEADFHLGSLW